MASVCTRLRVCSTFTPRLFNRNVHKLLKISPNSSNVQQRLFSDNVGRWIPRERWKTAATFGVGLTAGLLLSNYGLKGADDTLMPHVDAAESWDGDPPASKRFNFIADVVEKAAPAVVYIEIQGRHPFSGRNVALSNGSGFIVRSDGLVLTNAHVVANKQKVIVKLPDGRSMVGMVQAVDSISDLATIKIDGKNLPTIKLADSSKARPGEFVIAMGSPFQLSNTVTSGIISTVHRGSQELGLHNKDMQYIQTDAVINFGNSGGPLVNLDGEAIGINTMKVTTGISFAIPSDYASKFLDKAESMVHGGQTKGWFGRSSSGGSKRRYMGITMLTLTPSIIQELKLRMDFPDTEQGVLVHKVVVGSPAFNAGVQPGDIIIDINGNEVASSSDVYKAVESNGDLKIKILRGNHKYLLTVIPEGVE